MSNSKLFANKVSNNRIMYFQFHKAMNFQNKGKLWNIMVFNSGKINYASCHFYALRLLK